MGHIHVLLSGKCKKILCMGRLNAVCHTCKWNQSRMINPKNKRDIDEVERLMRVAHAATGCPAEPRVIRAPT